MKLGAGDQVIFRAKSLNVLNEGVSDPVAILIRFNNTPEFIANGTWIS